MSNRIEDLTRRGASIEEARSRIVRASSWRELFPTEQAEMADFIKHLVGNARAEYEENHTLRAYRVEQHPEGNLHVFERTMDGHRSTYQKLRSSGAVVITFIKPEGSSSNLVTPDVGNVAHNFTVANTVLPRSEILAKLSDEELQALTGTNSMVLTLYIKGKPAVKGWEDTMLYNDHFPQRIGHRIFPSFVLEAQARLMQARPELFK